MDKNESLLQNVVKNITFKSNIKDFSVFNIKHDLDKDILHPRKEIEAFASTISEFLIVGINQYPLIIGPTGSGKTAIVKFVLNELVELIDKPSKIHYVNCHIANNSYRVIKELTKVRQKIAKDQVFSGFIKMIEENKELKNIIILDEIDFLKDDDIIYQVTRNSAFDKTLLVMITTVADYYNSLSLDVKSSLNLKSFCFNPYNAEDVYAILKKRAEKGLINYDDSIIRQIASLNTKDCGGDVRVGIKTIEQVFKYEDYKKYDSLDIKKIMEEEELKIKNGIIHGLPEIKLKALYLAPTKPNSNMVYKELCANLGYKISKTYFFQIIDSLIKLGLLTAQRIRAGRTSSYQYTLNAKRSSLEYIKKLIDGYDNFTNSKS